MFTSMYVDIYMYRNTQLSMSMDSASTDSTNCRLKTFRGKNASLLSKYKFFSCHCFLNNAEKQLFTQHLCCNLVLQVV